MTQPPVVTQVFSGLKMKELAGKFALNTSQAVGSPWSFIPATQEQFRSIRRAEVENPPTSGELVTQEESSS
jgi:hypothetical protein